MSDENKTTEDVGAANEKVQQVLNSVAQAMSESKSLAEKIGQMDSARKQAIEKLEKTGESNSEQLERVRTAQSALDARMDQVVAQIQRVNTVTQSVEEGDGIASSEYKVKFEEHFRGLRHANLHAADLTQIMSADEATVGTEKAGGFLVPKDHMTGINQLVQKRGRMRDSVNVITTSKDTVVMDYVLTEPATEWVGETEDRSKTDTPDLGTIEINVHKIAAKPEVSEDLLEDTDFDFAGWLVNRVGRAFSRAQEDAFLNGNTKKRPRGVLTYDTVADDNWEWGKIGVIKTGFATAFHGNTGNPATAFNKCEAALDEMYVPDAYWMMTRKTMSVVRDIVDDNKRPIFVDARDGGFPTIYGIPVRVNDYMPEVGDGNFPVMLISRDAYTIVDRRGMRMVRDNITRTGFEKFAASQRVGGGVSNFEAVKLIQTAA